RPRHRRGAGGQRGVPGAGAGDRVGSRAARPPACLIAWLDRPHAPAPRPRSRGALRRPRSRPGSLARARPASLHRLVLATEASGNETGRTTPSDVPPPADRGFRLPRGPRRRPLPAGARDLAPLPFAVAARATGLDARLRRRRPDADLRGARRRGGVP